MKTIHRFLLIVGIALLVGTAITVITRPPSKPEFVMDWETRANALEIELMLNNEFFTTIYSEDVGNGLYYVYSTWLALDIGDTVLLYKSYDSITWQYTTVCKPLNNK